MAENSRHTIVSGETKQFVNAFMVPRYKFIQVYVVIATKPVHRLHSAIPSCAVLWMRRGTDRHTVTETAMASTHFASTLPHAKCKKRFRHCDNYTGYRVVPITSNVGPLLTERI